MSTEPKVETAVTEEPKKQAETEEPAQAETVSIEEHNATKAALKAANSEAAERRRKLEAYEKAEKERDEAEMSEMDKLNKRLEETEAERDSLIAKDDDRKASDEKKKLQQSAAEKVGLPNEFSDRVRGETSEEMEADAKVLLDAMPVKPKPKVLPTNSGGGELGDETFGEKSARLL